MHCACKHCHLPIKTDFQTVFSFQMIPPLQGLGVFSNVYLQMFTSYRCEFEVKLLNAIYIYVFILFNAISFLKLMKDIYFSYIKTKNE